MEGVGLFTQQIKENVYIISDILADDWTLGWDSKDIDMAVNKAVNIILKRET